MRGFPQGGYGRLVAEPGESADETERWALIRNLQAAMETRAPIEQAKGILMATHRCSPDEAFEMLSTESQTQNRKLRDVANDLIARTQTKPPEPT
jgi:AmiR/NasT family two-component response regulator